MHCSDLVKNGKLKDYPVFTKNSCELKTHLTELGYERSRAVPKSNAHKNSPHEHFFYLFFLESANTGLNILANHLRFYSGASQAALLECGMEIKDL